MSAKKPKQVRVYLNEEAAELNKAAADAIGDISESQIISILVLAGLRAIRDKGFRLSLPLVFNVVDGALPPPAESRAGIAVNR